MYFGVSGLIRERLLYVLWWEQPYKRETSVCTLVMCSLSYIYIEKKIKKQHVRIIL
jgi:hypothetical protein